MKTILIVTSLAGAAAVLAWRVRETTRPVTVRKIVLPPLGMSSGFCMFGYPPARIPTLWALSAFAIGALLLSYPLLKSSRLVRRGDVVMLERSKAFLWILLGLVAVRLAARSYVEQYVSPLQTGSIFFIMAFGMIVRWRMLMYREYRQLQASAARNAESESQTADNVAAS
jgi:membrane protein CcdC involved in cytochrome C biogenesis